MTTQNIPISSLPIAIGLDGSEIVPIVQGGVTKRTTIMTISGDTTGFVPTSRRINTVNGIDGGGDLSEDLTLKLDLFSLATDTGPVLADWLVLNQGSSTTPVKVAPTDFFGLIDQLTEKTIPVEADFAIVYSIADQAVRKVDLGNLGIPFGNVPTLGTTGQALIKRSDESFDVEWGVVPVIGGGTGVTTSTGTISVVLSNEPTLVSPTFEFGTGASNNIVAASTNTGFENLFQVINSGDVSNSGTLAFLAATLSAAAGTFVGLTLSGGASPSALLSTGAGVTGGLTIQSGAGPLSLVNPNITNATGTSLTLSGTLRAATMSSIFDPGAVVVGVGGQLNLTANSGDGIIPYGAVKAYATNGAAGTEAGDLVFYSVRGGALTEQGRFTSAGQLHVPATTATSSPTTGALTIAGGVGIGADINVGGTIRGGGAIALAGFPFAIGSSTYNIIQSPDGTNAVQVGATQDESNYYTNGRHIFFDRAGTTLATIDSFLLTLSQTTASTSFTTGALVVAGGVGIAGSLNVQSTATVGATLNITDAPGTQSSIALQENGLTKWQIGKQTDNSFFIYDTAGSQNFISAVSGGALVLDPVTTVNIATATSSTSTTTGALTVNGGAGVAGALNVGVQTSSPQFNAVAAVPNYVWRTIGQGTDQNIWDSLVSGLTLDFRAVNDAFTAANNWLVVTRGVGASVANVNLPTTTASTSPTTGALTIAGGVGIAGALNVAGALNAVGGIDITGTLTVSGAVNVTGASGYELSGAAVLQAQGNFTALLDSTAGVTSGLFLGNATAGESILRSPTLLIQSSGGASTFASFAAGAIQLNGAVTGTSVATVAEYYAGTANVLVPAGVIYPTETSTTFGATTTFDFSTFINTEVTLTGNITTQTLTNIIAGKSGTIRFIQDATGARTTVWNSNFKWPGGVPPVLSVAPNAVDILTYDAITPTFILASLITGVA